MIINAKKRLAAKSIHTMILPMGSDYEEYANILSQSKPGDIFQFGKNECIALAEDTFAHKVRNECWITMLDDNKNARTAIIPLKMIKDIAKWVK